MGFYGELTPAPPRSAAGRGRGPTRGRAAGRGLLETDVSEILKTMRSNLIRQLGLAHGGRVDRATREALDSALFRAAFYGATRERDRTLELLRTFRHVIGGNDALMPVGVLESQIIALSVSDVVNGPPGQ
jgi:hypothetical protein